jgi:hypothetical protein
MVSKTRAGNYNLTLTIETLARVVLERASTTGEFGEVTVVWANEPIPIPGFPWPAIAVALIGAAVFSLRRRKGKL